ncbi:MAG TPA: L-lactate dehydrogenase [Deinococcales bacterium]|nr:L-lactate dehydrogenase [Deinococcales bacterium]
MKIGIVGAGFVGAAAGYAMVLRGSCSDLALVDMNAAKAEAEAADIGDAAPVSHPVRVTAGDYPVLSGASLVVLTAGANQKPGEDRLSLLGRNAAIFRDIVPRVLENAPGAVIVVATNPVDILTALTARLAGPEMAGKVFGSGTVLDTARLRAEIAARANVDPQHVHAYVLGEHGDSEMIAWTHADIAGLPIPEFFAARGLKWSPDDQQAVAAKVRGAAGTIIKGKGATYYGVGAGLARIAEAVLRDARAVLTVSAPSEDYGVSLSLPRLVGGGGLLGEIKPVLSTAEAQALSASAGVLKAAAESL